MQFPSPLQWSVLLSVPSHIFRPWRILRKTMTKWQFFKPTVFCHMTVSALSVVERLILRSDRNVFQCYSSNVKKNKSRNVFLNNKPDKSPISYGPNSREVVSNPIPDQLLYAQLEDQSGSGGLPSWLWWKYLNMGQDKMGGKGGAAPH